MIRSVGDALVVSSTSLVGELLGSSGIWPVQNHSSYSQRFCFGGLDNRRLKMMVLLYESIR